MASDGRISLSYILHDNKVDFYFYKKQIGSFSLSRLIFCENDEQWSIPAKIGGVMVENLTKNDDESSQNDRSARRKNPALSDC